MSENFFGDIPDSAYEADAGSYAGASRTIGDEADDAVRAHSRDHFNGDVEPELDPVDFWGVRIIDDLDLPIGLLPKVIEDFAIDCGGGLGITPAAVAFPCLAVVATAIREAWVIQPSRSNSRWLEPAIIWTAISGYSGVRKSPAIKRAMAPLRQIEAGWRQDDARLDKAHRDDLERWKTDYARWKKNGHEGPSPDEPEKPAKRRAIVSDATIEKLIELCRDNPSGVIMERDELVGWVASFGKYSGDPDSDKKKYLSAYDGAPDSVDRMSRETFARRVAVSVVGGIQDDVVAKRFSKMEDDGFLARFMIVRAARRPVVEGEPNASVEAAYAGLIDRLISMDTNGIQQVVKMSEGAEVYRKRLEEFADAVREMPWINASLRDHSSKWEGMFARLCLLWHMCESPAPEADEVTENIARRVFILMRDFLLPEAQRVHLGLLDKSSQTTEIEDIADFILATGATALRPRDVALAVRSLRTKTREIDEALRNLETLAWVRPSGGIVKTTGKVREWTVNERVHVLFASRAEMALSKAARADSAIRKFRELKGAK